MEVIALTKHNFEQEVLAAKEPVLIYFVADWSDACAMQEATVKEVVEEQKDKIKVCKVDVDAQAALALDYRVVNIPTIIFMYQGMFQERMIGLQDKDTLVNYINSIDA